MAAGIVRVLSTTPRMAGASYHLSVLGVQGIFLQTKDCLNYDKSQTGHCPYFYFLMTKVRCFRIVYPEQGNTVLKVKVRIISAPPFENVNCTILLFLFNIYIYIGVYYTGKSTKRMHFNNPKE